MSLGVSIVPALADALDERLQLHASERSEVPVVGSAGVAGFSVFHLLQLWFEDALFL